MSDTAVSTRRRFQLGHLQTLGIVLGVLGLALIGYEALDRWEGCR